MQQIEFTCLLVTAITIDNELKIWDFYYFLQNVLIQRVYSLFPLSSLSPLSFRISITSITYFSFCSLLSSGSHIFVLSIIILLFLPYFTLTSNKTLTLSNNIFLSILIGTFKRCTQKKTPWSWEEEKAVRKHLHKYFQLRILHGKEEFLITIKS